jgi:hypothetical protein
MPHTVSRSHIVASHRWEHAVPAKHPARNVLAFHLRLLLSGAFLTWRRLRSDASSMVLPSMVMILSVIIGRTSLLFPLQTTQTPVLPLTVEQFVQSPEPLLYNLSVLFRDRAADCGVKL